MDENRQGATEGACKHIVINEDSGVSSRDSHEAAPSIDKEITEEIRPLVVAEMKRYGEKLRRIRQHYESKLKKFEDMQVEWIAMRDQEEIAVRVSREQEREIAELRQQLASAKEEVRKTKRLVSELVEKAAKGEAAILGLLKRTTAKDEELSLLERKVESLKSIIRGKQREGVDGKGCDSGTHGISKEKTKAVVSEEEFFKKSRQMACDLDAIYNEVQMAISGTVPDNECSLRSTLETELARLRERSARWKWESELLQKKQAEVKEKIDEMVPITKKILDSLTAFENFLQRPLCSNSNTAENSFIANSELCDENKAHLSEPSDERVLRKSEVRPSAAVASTNGCQQQIENEETVFPSNFTPPGDSKQMRRGQESAMIPHKRRDMLSREMNLVFGGVVRTKIVEELCSSKSTASTSKDNQSDVRRILVFDCSPSRGRGLVPPKRKGAGNFPDSKSKQIRTMQQCLKQASHVREVQPVERAQPDISGDEGKSRDNNA